MMGNTAVARRAHRLLGVVLMLLAGCAAAADVPDGWQRFDAGGLRGAYPQGWQPRATQQRGWSGAAVEVAGPQRPGSLAPVLVLYAEGGGVIATEDRAALITARLQEELGAELVDRTAPRVPGAADGLILEFAFDARVAGSSKTVPSRQFEVILDAADGRTFDLMLGGPVDTLDQSTIDSILDSLHIT